MKRLIYLSFSYTRYVIALLVLLSGYSALGQTPGLILKPATGAGAAIMDPDGDGYVSQKTAGQQLGFRTNDVAESEIPFVAIVRPDPLGDILRGPVGGFTEIVGTDAAGNNAILTYTDGINLYFRFRLSGYAPNSKAYSILIDTDQKFGFSGPNADPDALAGNAGFEVEIVLRTNFSVDVYNVNGTTNGTLVATHNYDTNCQKSIALSTAGNSPDYFYDFYVPYPSLFSGSTALRYVASTGMSPSPAMGSNSASDVGGVTASGVSLDQVYADLINVQTPTVPGQEVLDRTDCPTINGPISSGATTVSGTAGDNGSTIRLYVNDVQVGSTTVSGTNWTVSGLTPLVGGAALKATAQAIGKGESSGSCNLTFVGSSCSITPVAVSIDNGDKGGRVTNVSSYPVGTVFTLYSAATNAEWVDSRDNNPYTITTTDITRGTIDIGCGGTGNCLDDGSYYIVAKAPSECESQKAYFCVGSAISASSVPVIDNTILPLSSYVTGTNGVAGAVLYVYANGVQIGSKTLLTSGAWSVPVPSAILCNTSLTARQIAPSQCISAISTTVAIGYAITSAPTISIDKCNSTITSVTGFSGESDGTTIQLYVNGVQRSGSATVSAGKWTFNTSTITAGQTITARATNSLACKTQSDLSAPVTLSGTTTLTGSYSIPSTVAEGASSVSVVVSGMSGSYTLNLYIDGDKIGSQSFTGSGTVVVPVTYTSDIYTGGKLQVSLTEGSKCESNLSAVLKTVECNTPSFTNSVISTPLTNRCVTTSGSITVTNSQTGVIYTPVDASGNVKGYSVLGTGGTITLTTHAFPASGAATFFVKAQRIVPSGTCDATSTTSVSFNAFAPPQYTVHPASKIVCSGESTSLTASWTGIGPFNVQWQVNHGSGFVNLTDGGIYSQTSAMGITSTSATFSISNVSGLDNYTFRCIVTDNAVPADCQSNTSNVSTLSVPIVTISNALVTNATSGNNGSIGITASGGTGPYTYDWHHLNGAGTFGDSKDLTGLSEGTYTVTVKDANECMYQQSFIVGGVSSINLGFVSQTNVTCYGAINGSFTVSASSGIEPYSYSIDNFTTSQANGTFSGLPPGSYIVKARDAALKPSNTVLVTITEPLEMVVSAVISNPSVLLYDGSIHATITGGTNNFSCSLYKAGTATAIKNYTNAGREIDFSDLSEGTYSIQVTDANGCTASKTNIVLTAPVVQTVQCSHTASHSFNDNSISGYDGNFNYFASDWIESPLGGEIQIYGSALAFGRIPADNNTYSWNTSSSIYREIDLQGASSIVLSYKVQAYGATNQDNFTVQLYVNDALHATYNMASSHLYSTQSTVTINNIPFKTISGNSLNKIEFRISTGQSRSNLRIDDFTLTFTKSLSVGVVTSPATCNNGKVDLSIIGGYPPYFVDWDNDGTGDFNDLEDLTGLSPGTYKVTVKDSRNCTTTQLTAVVGSSPLVASFTGSSNPTCVGGGSNGSVTATVSATGDGSPYIYQLYKGAAELVSSIYSASATKTFTGLTSGTYYVKVIQSSDNCSTQTAPVTLTMPVLTSNLTATGATTICSGSSTTIKVDVTGGTSPYSVELSNGQSITNYTSGAPIVVTPAVSTTLTVVSVTDASSCMSSSNSGSVDITVNPTLPVGVSLLASPSGAICSGTSVTFTATPSNAGANPTYTWKVGATTVGANSATYTTSSLVNGDVVTCIITKDPAEACNTGSPATSNALVMVVRTSPTVNAGNNILTCSTYGAVNITAGATASNYSSVIWTSNGTGTFTNANSLSLASYSPSSNDIAIGTVTLTLTAFANAPCNNAVSTKTLTITSGQTADFSYPDSPYCSNEANPLPVFSEGAIGGIFSSTPGLVFISTSTGQINLSASTPGNYTITNTIAASGGCGVATATYDITIFQDGSWTGAINQDWNNAGNWACNQIPTIVTNVFIANGLPNYPLLSTGASGKAYHITIEDEASVTVSGNTLQIAGDISNAGTFTATEGTIEMKGSVAQSISANVFSTNTLMNLIINNAAGVTLGGALNITGIVTPALGNFNSAGYLTLVSTVSQTALIEGTGSGSITGNINMQRYLPSSFGYKYFSSPFQGATVAELADEVNLTETFPTFYTYDENHSRDSLGHTVYYSGWTKYTETTNALIPMAGYAANMGTGTLPVTVTMSGVVNNGTISTTLYNRNRKYTKGFNLVGNPYPSPIDWNAGGWTKTNIDNALYFFNAGNTDRYTGIYSSYVNGVSTGNATNIIAAMQGFFVHVTDPVSVSDYPVSATLGTTNSVRINNLNPVFKSASIDPRPAIRLSAGFELNHAIEDAAVVYFDPTASVRFDKEKDALKLKNTDEQVPNIYTLADGHKLSINGLSEPSDSVSFIPIGLTTYRDGWINLRAENADELPFMQVYLSDAETGKYHDLIRSSEVRFYLPRGICESRFKLVFSKAPFTGEYPGAERLFKLIRTDNQVMIKVNLPLGTKGNLMVTDVLGQSLLRKEVSGKETVSIGQKSVTGVYVITLVSGRRTESEKILMRQDYE